MIVPSIKQMFLFFVLNLHHIFFFNILLSNMPTFLTYESFSIFLTNSNKISMLVSAFILTCFMLNLLLFGVFFKNGFKRSLLNIVRVIKRRFLNWSNIGSDGYVVNEIK